ncbi:MAG: OmpA family protein [Acidimicrobiia bacterium]|nr:OmpA family protein [Acidimicrobiia bacterium]
MTTDRRRLKSVLIGGVIGLFVLLLGTAVVWGVQNEENDIRDRVSAALADANIGIQEIEVEGRDVLLSGASGEDARAAAENVVRELDGVRTVVWNDLPDVVIITDPTQAPTDGSTTSGVPLTTLAGNGGTSVAPSTTPTEPPPGVANISASLNQGVLTLSGAVPDAESAARIAGVADLIYAPFVVGEVTVDPSLETASWVPGAAAVIGRLPIVSTSSITLAGEAATITGNAPTDVRKAQLEGALAQVLGPEVAVDSQVSVTNLAAPFLAASAPGDGTMNLEGVVPSQAVAERIVGAAVQVYGEDNVTGSLEVQGDVAETFSLFRVPLVFIQFAPVPQWEFTIDDDVITGALKGGATFEYGSSQLSDQLVVLLNTAAGILVRNPTLVGTVEGHTDDVGSEGFNQTLSESRAQSAVDYLIAAGVDAARVFAIGYGESRPIGDNSTEEGRAINRRIEFFLGPAPQGGA